MDKLLAFVAVMLLVLILAVIMALPTMLLWNFCLVPAVPALAQIGFWQALGINLLCSILFKSSGSISN